MDQGNPSKDGRVNYYECQMIAVKKWHSILLYAFFGKCKSLCVTIHVFLCFII